MYAQLISTLLILGQFVVDPAQNIVDHKQVIINQGAALINDDGDMNVGDIHMGTDATITSDGTTIRLSEQEINLGLPVPSSNGVVLKLGGPGVAPSSDGSKLFIRADNSFGNTVTEWLLDSNNAVGTFSFGTEDTATLFTIDKDGNIVATGTVTGSGGTPLFNVVEDTTPQLGGNLSLNSQDIVGAGNIAMTTGDITLDLGDVELVTDAAKFIVNNPGNDVNATGEMFMSSGLMVFNTTTTGAANNGAYQFKLGGTANYVMTTTNLRPSITGIDLGVPTTGEWDNLYMEGTANIGEDIILDNLAASIQLGQLSGGYGADAVLGVIDIFNSDGSGPGASVQGSLTAKTATSFGVGTYWELTGGHASSQNHLLATFGGDDTKDVTFYEDLFVTGNIDVTGGNITGGVNDSVRGTIKAFGASGSGGGGILQLNNDADNDATVGFWHVIPQGLTMELGPNTDTDAFIFEDNGDFTASGDLESNNDLRVGVADITRGVVRVTGDAATSGSLIQLSNAALEDTTVEYWQHAPNGVTYNFGANTDADAFMYTDAGIFTALTGLTSGLNDLTRGVLRLNGDNGTLGGLIQIYNSASEDGTVEYWQHAPNAATYNFGPNTDTDAFAFTSAGEMIVGNFTAGNVAANNIVISEDDANVGISLLGATGGQTKIFFGDDVGNAEGSITYDVSSNRFLFNTNNLLAMRLTSTQAVQAEHDLIVLEDAIVNGFISVGTGQEALELNIAGISTAAPTRTRVTLDTYLDAATDTCITIVIAAEGSILIVRQEDNARDILFDDATGNLRLNGDAQFVDTDNTLTLMSNGTNWFEISRSLG